MGTKNILPEATVTFKHRDWSVIPDTAKPNYFKLKETKTGKVLGTFILPEGGDPGLLNRIASAPELEDIAEMYHTTTIGEQAKKSAEKTTSPHREWHVIRNANHPYRFDLEDIKTAKVLGTFALPESGDTKFLNRIACAPELESIAKTFRNMMIGSRYEKSMVFSIDPEVLRANIK